MGKNEDIYKYYCRYCANEFEQRAREVTPSVGDFSGKPDKVSDAVKCTKCGNFVKTWEAIIK